MQALGCGHRELVYLALTLFFLPGLSLTARGAPGGQGGVSALSPHLAQSSVQSVCALPEQMVLGQQEMLNSIENF